MLIAWEDTKSTILLKILGGTIMFWAAIHLLIGLIILSNQNFLINLIDKDFRGNPYNYFYFMPILLMIGISYLILGIRLPKIRTKKLIFHIVISISLIIWTICWILFNHKRQVTGTELTNFKEIIANPISLAIILVAVLIPQIIIGIKLYKIEKGHNAT